MGKKKMVAEATTEAEITTTEIPIQVQAETATATEVPVPEPTKPKRGKKKATPVTEGPLTISTLSDGYLKHLADGEWSGGTIASYSMELKTAQSEIGAETLVSDLTAERVREFFDSPRVTKLRSGKAKAKPSIDKTRRVLRLALVWAQEAGLIETAPIPELALAK